jgi:hypothetical protein
MSRCWFTIRPTGNCVRTGLKRWKLGVCQFDGFAEFRLVALFVPGVLFKMFLGEDAEEIKTFQKR